MKHGYPAALSSITTRGTNQNKADTQFANVVPSMPGYGTPYDAPFANMLTPEDQIHWLYVHLKESPQTNDYDDLKREIEELKSRMDKLESMMSDLVKQMEELRSLVKSTSEGAFSYDVTAGDYAPARTAARRIAQVMNPWGMTVEELAMFEVGQAAQFIVGGIVVNGRWDYLLESTNMEGVEVYRVQPQLGATYAAFNPSDYIKLSDLELIDVENLELGTIYGVPKSKLATGVYELSPYMRPAKVSDLDTAQILFNGHFVTKEVQR